MIRVMMLISLTVALQACGLVERNVKGGATTH